MEASLQKHDRLNNWPLAIESTSSPSLSLDVGVMDGSPKPLIIWLVPWQPNPILKFKTYLINIQKTQTIPRVLGPLPETQTETKYVLL